MNKQELINATNDVPLTHIIEAKFLPPTNYTGARVKLTSKLHKQSIYVGFHSSDFSTTSSIALGYLISKGFKVLGFGEFGKVYYISVSTDRSKGEFKKLKD